MQEYQRGAATFYGMHDAYPGDMNNASSFYSGVTNGDGDGDIEWQSDEDHHALHHLKSAGLTEHDYTGLTGNGKMANLIFSYPNTTGLMSYISDMFDISGNVINPTGLNSFNDAILTGVNAKAIDDKIDDGAPSKGFIFARAGNNKTAGTHCVSHAYTVPASTNVTWILSGTGPECMLYYLFEF